MLQLLKTLFWQEETFCPVSSGANLFRYVGYGGIRQNERCNFQGRKLAKIRGWVAGSFEGVRNTGIWLPQTLPATCGVGQNRGTTIPNLLPHTNRKVPIQLAVSRSVTSSLIRLHPFAWLA